MKPFFRAVGPDFQKNLVFGNFETVNVYPLMCHLLGINPEINDGHLDNTKHMLVPKKNTEGNQDSKRCCNISDVNYLSFYHAIFLQCNLGMNRSIQASPGYPALMAPSPEYIFFYCVLKAGDSHIELLGSRPTHDSLFPHIKVIYCTKLAQTHVWLCW